MDPFTRELAAVETSFTPSTPQDEKIDKFVNLLMRHGGATPSDPINLRVSGNEAQLPEEQFAVISYALMAATTRHGVAHEFARRLLAQKYETNGSFRPPLVKLPCANVDPNEHRACDSDGTKACSGCRLVSYCSQGCQKQHWKRHKEGEPTAKVASTADPF